MRKRIFSLLLIVTIALCAFPSVAWGFYYDNPAEEAFSTTRFELLIPQITLGARNNLFNLDNINIDLTKPEAKDKFLSQMKGGYFKSDFSSELKTGLTIGRFSLHLHPWATGSFRLAPGIPELVFVGYGPNDDGTSKTYDLAGTKVNGLAALSLDLKYGHPIPLQDGSQLGVGVTFRFIKGLAMADSEVTSGTLRVDQTGEATLNAESRYLYTDLPEGEVSFNNSSGAGFLTDLGVSYTKDRWRAGLALKNIGAIKWKNLQQGTYTYDGEVTTGPDGPEFSEDNATTTETVISKYTLSLPLVLEAQGSYHWLESLYCHLGMETGFADGWGISSSPRLWTGLEWKPRHLVRMAGGISYHDKHWDYNALLELHLFCLWANVQLGWVHQLGGFNASTMLALHF